MVLSKANMDIAFEYLNCVKKKKLRNIYQIILHEWQLTKDIILMIEEQDELLAENPYLKESLDYRMPYFNVLNYIQLELIRRQRTGQLPADQDKANPYYDQWSGYRITKFRLKKSERLFRFFIHYPKEQKVCNGLNRRFKMRIFKARSGSFSKRIK